MAKKFSFRLEPLLSIRSHKAQIAREELSRIVNMRRERELRIEAHLKYINSLLLRRESSSKAAEYQTKIHHIEFIESEINNLRKEIQQISEIEEIKREILNNALKQEKILQKLKERRLAEYKEEADREEINLMNEIALRNFEYEDK